MCEPPQSKCTSASHFIRKFTGKMPRPKTTAHTLCEPGQSKRVSRFHKPQYRNLPEKCGGAKPRPTLCASLHACQDFTRATLCGILAQKPRPTLCASLRSRNAWQDFKRATLFFAEIKKKCRVPKPRPTDCVSLHSRNAMKRMSTFHKSQLMENFTGKMRET